MKNNLKRIVSFLIVCVMMVSVLPLVPEAQCSAARKAGNRVAIINSDPNESGYRNANVRDFKKVFGSSKRYVTTYYYSINNDERLEATKQCINKGVDYLVILGDVNSGWKKTLKRARAKGIKVILIDCDPGVSKKYYDALVASDMKKSADVAIRWLERQKMDSYKILHLQGSIGSQAQIGRSQALFDGIKKNGWEYVAGECADWNQKEAEKFVKKAIKKGYDFNIIYAENDNMALGAEEALDDAGISHGIGGKVSIIGFDADIWALRKLCAGKWNFDVQCSPFYAKDVLGVINKLRAGKAIPGKTVIVKDRGFDASTITQKDVQKYGI